MNSLIRDDKIVEAIEAADLCWGAGTGFS